MMVRTQVQLTEAQIQALRQLSAVSGESIAELIRKGVDQYLAGRLVPPLEDRIERAIRVAGKFSSGLSDVSEDHDRYLDEAFGQ